MGALTNVSVAQDGHPLGIGGHDAVLDAVMHHLDEVAGAARPAVQVALLGSAAQFFSAGSSGDFTYPRRQRFENRIKSPNRLVGAPDHHAVAALSTPDATARPHVHILDLL